MLISDHVSYDWPFPCILAQDSVPASVGNFVVVVLPARDPFGKWLIHRSQPACTGLATRRAGSDISYLPQSGFAPRSAIFPSKLPATK